MRLLSSKNARIIALLFLFSMGTPAVVSWMLSQLGLNETYRVRHLSMHYGRVFLSIRVKSNSFPTLIESHWPENFVPLHASIFPSPSAHDTDPREQRDCRHLQQSMWTQVDSLNRLWVMDIGWHRAQPNSCNPKLVVYDLLRQNIEVMRIDCSRYISPNPNELLAIKLGPPTAKRCRTVEKYIYFLRADDSHILAYDIVEQRWQQRLLVSRKYEQMISEMLPIKPIDIAFAHGKQELLISDINGDLYRSENALLLHDKTECGHQNNTIPNDDNPAAAANNVPLDLEGQLAMEHLGSLLGPSRGLMLDFSNVLFYVVPKFGAVVRCPNYRKNLTAEGNEIIYMTGKNIQQMFFGSKDSVWLVTDRELHPDDHCFASLT